MRTTVVASLLATLSIGCAGRAAVPAPPSATPESATAGKAAERTRAAAAVPRRIVVGPDARTLTTEDGKPFFYVADTAWELAHRLDSADVERYLADRAAKRFTAFHFVLLPEIDGLDTPNANGDLPLHDHDPRRPNEAYFRHVDHIVDRAAAHGLYAGVLPTWGSYAVKEKHVLFRDHFLFPDPDTAKAWGRFLGTRYAKRPNVLWILGGDRNPEGYVDNWRGMAAGIIEAYREAGVKTPPVITYHAQPGTGPGATLEHEPWLSLRTIQSGHRRDSAPHEMLTDEWGRTPPRPVLNGEPGYERHPDKTPGATGKMDDQDVRRFAYWSAFAGACGHTYGANEIWLMWRPELEPIAKKVKPPFLGAERPWWEALDYPGARQMRHLRALVESRPMLGRVPDQTLVVDPGEGLTHVRATRGGDGSYAFVYLPAAGQTVNVRLGKLAGGAGGRVSAHWFDPSTGQSRDAGEHPTEGPVAFTAPPEWRDAVLVLDDAKRAYPPPGR